MRTPVLLVALLVTTAPLAATATTKFLLTNSAWTDLGAGPLMLSMAGTGVYAVGDAQPALNAEGFAIPKGGAVSLKTTSHVWAMASGAPGAAVYAAPIVPAVSPNCAQGATYLARTSGGAEGGNALNIKNLICGLVSDGVITGNLSGATGGCGTYLDGLYVFAQQNVADAKLNLCGTSYSLTVNASTVFQSYIGFHVFPASAGGAMDTGFNISSAPAAKWQLNSASLGAWTPLVVNENAPVAASIPGGTNTNMYLSFNGINFLPRINSGSTGGIPKQGTKGLYVGERSSAALTTFFWNGTSQGTSSAASVALDNATLAFGGVNAGTASTVTLSEGHMGASLGGVLNLALYNRLRIYMTAVGVP